MYGIADQYFSTAGLTLLLKKEESISSFVHSGFEVYFWAEYTNDQPFSWLAELKRVSGEMHGFSHYEKEIS